MKPTDLTTPVHTQPASNGAMVTTAVGSMDKGVAIDANQTRDFSSEQSAPQSRRLQLHVWVTSEEFECLRRAAEQVDRSVSSFVRCWIRAIRGRQART